MSDNFFLMAETNSVTRRVNKGDQSPAAHAHQGDRQGNDIRDHLRRTGPGPRNFPSAETGLSEPRGQHVDLLVRAGERSVDQPVG